MIQKHRCGKGFGGLLRYCLNQSRELGHEGAHIIDTDQAGRDAEEYGHGLEAIAAMNPRVQKPVYHVTLRLAPGEHLSDERWREISRQYLERMGFAERGYVVVAHPGAKHDPNAGHVHIIANRVPYDGGKAVSRSNDHYRADRIVRELEREHHLERARAKDRAPTPAGRPWRDSERVRER